jgi:RimJ/RimL family protein N-acetyltransferase
MNLNKYFNEKANDGVIALDEGNGISLRFATIKDASDIYQWQYLDNPQDKNLSQINFEDVRSGIQAYLDHEGAALFIAEKDGKSIGHSALVEQSPHEYEIAYMTATDYRRQGYGTAIASITSSLLPMFDLVAKVKHENGPSLKIMKALGFTEDKDLSDRKWARFRKTSQEPRFEVTTLRYGSSPAIQ